MADEDLDPNVSDIARLPRPERYTITPDDLSLHRDYGLFQLNMETWYYSEWADPISGRRWVEQPWETVP